jgi:hypothetical protein
MEQLKTMPVQRVAVPDFNPAQRRCAAGCPAIGILVVHCDTPRRKDLCRGLESVVYSKARSHSVTGATLKPETATAEIAA